MRVSGGYTVPTLPLFYWYIYVKDHHHKWLRIFSAVGTHSIFIYLFAETAGNQWLRDFGRIFTQGLQPPLGTPEGVILVLNSLFVLFMFRYLTWFPDRHRIYFKI